MWKGPVDTVQIDVPRRLFRAMHFRPLHLLVSALTGVSVTFCPLLLYSFGKDQIAFGDWRVLTCLAVTCLVPLVYMRFGAPVLALAWRSSRNPERGECKKTDGVLPARKIATRAALLQRARGTSAFWYVTAACLVLVLTLDREDASWARAIAATMLLGYLGFIDRRLDAMLHLLELETVPDEEAKGAGDSTVATPREKPVVVEVGVPAVPEDHSSGDRAQGGR